MKPTLKPALKIVKLNPKDVAYNDGARWALVMPAWLGTRVTMIGLKAKTLENAINMANMEKPLLVEKFGTATDDIKHDRMDPQNVEVLEDRLAIVKTNWKNGRAGKPGFIYQEYLNNT